MNIRVFKVISACLAAGIAVGSISMHKCGSEKKIALQSPSLFDPDAVQFEGLYGAALDIDDSGVVPMSYSNANFDINQFTIVADTAYTDIASEYGKNPGDPLTYDGGTYWIVRDTVLIVAKDEDSSDSQDNEDEVIYLSLSDSVTRLSYVSEWSLVKLADGRQGYVKNSYLSAEEITPVPTATPEPEIIDDGGDDDYTEPDSGSSSSYTPEPEPDNSGSSGNDWEEYDRDMTVYASCALNTRSGPGISYSLLYTLSFGSAIYVVAETDNGWYKSSEGYYVKASLTLDSEPEPPPAPEPYYGGDSGDSDFASYIKSFIGCSYVYGGASPDGFDCSGFVMYCYQTYYDIYLPHGATSQSYRGYEVDPSDIQVGDIICFDRNGDGTMEHSALYVGNDTYVHAQGAATGVVASCYSSATGIATIRRVL